MTCDSCESVAKMSPAAKGMPYTLESVRATAPWEGRDPPRPGAYSQFCQYLTGQSGSLITIGFEKQQIITRRGVCKGVEPNAGNPLYNFINWTVDLKNN